MTEGPPGPTGPATPPDPEVTAEPEPASTAADDAPEAPEALSPVREPGLFRFSIEGRRAPGLFVAGWLTTLVGTLAAIVGFLAGQSPAAVILFVAALAVLLLGLVLLAGSQTVERRAVGRAYAGPSPILVFVATVAALYLAVVIVLTPLDLLDVRLEGPVLSLFGVVIQAAAVVVVLRLLVVGPGALRWRDMGLGLPPGAAVRDLAWGALLAGPVILVTAVAIQLLVLAIGEVPESPLPPTGTPTGLLINLVAGGLIAPVYEELLFRGFATTAWARAVPAAQAILRTSILFAAAHVITQGGETFGEAFGLAIVAAGARFPVALALGWVFLRRRSLWAAIGLHATFNTILILLAEYALSSGLA